MISSFLPPPETRTDGVLCRILPTTPKGAILSPDRSNRFFSKRNPARGKEQGEGLDEARFQYVPRQIDRRVRETDSNDHAEELAGGGGNNNNVQSKGAPVVVSAFPCDWSSPRTAPCDAHAHVLRHAFNANPFSFFSRNRDRTDEVEWERSSRARTAGMGMPSRRRAASRPTALS